MTLEPARKVTERLDKVLGAAIRGAIERHPELRRAFGTRQKATEEGLTS
jgi:hypothetical protein